MGQGNFLKFILIFLEKYFINYGGEKFGKNLEEIFIFGIFEEKIVRKYRNIRKNRY